MNKEDIKITILRYPTEEDWMRAKTLALNTVGKKAVTMPNEDWKYKILKSEHSPARTLMFTILVSMPYCNSVHFVRHKFGIEHYVSSQRNDRQDNYDRKTAPQDAMVTHIMDVNAAELIFMSHRRLCMQADADTRYIMEQIKKAVSEVCPPISSLLVPQCEYLHECPEFYPCGKWTKDIHITEKEYNELKKQSEELKWIKENTLNLD